MAFVDWTSGWTETDTDGILTVGANHIEVDIVGTSAVADQVWKNFGAGYFAGDFVHYVDGQVDATPDNATAILLWTMHNTNGVNPYSDDNGFACSAYWPGTKLTLYLEDLDNDKVDNSWTDAIVVGTRFYLVIERSGTTLTAKIYNNAEHSGDPVDTLTCTEVQETAFSTLGMGTHGGADDIHGDIYNLDIGVTGDSLTATGITTTPVIAIPTIGQTHALTATEITIGAPTLETPTIGTGADALTAIEIATGAPTLANPTIGQTHALTATEIATGAPALETATIGQTHELTATEIATGAPVLDVPTSGQAHALDATEISTGAPTFATPTIGQTHSLLADDLYASQPTLDTAILAQIHALVASGIITGPPELGTPAIDAGIHQELVLVTGEFTQLMTATGVFTQLETVTGAFTPLVTVSGKLLEED